MEKILLHELLLAVGGKLLTAENKNAGKAPEKADTENIVSGNSISEKAVSGDKDIPEAEILSVVTDSRKIAPGCVFFALCGDRFDGHAFVDSALGQGAAGCVISKEPDKLLPGKFYVLVEDTLRALGKLAHYYRMKFNVKVIGITGSVGKTTCREMVSAVLSGRFRVHSTKGNFNNEIGLPMTIFDLSPEDEVMVLEMGMNHFGEISRLTKIASPDIAVITNIGTAHIGILGSRENIFLAKKEIFEGMKEGSAAVLCGDDDYLPRIAEDPAFSGKYRIFYAGKSELCSYRGRDVRIDVSGMEADSRDASILTACTVSMPDVRPVLSGTPDSGAAEKTSSGRNCDIDEKTEAALDCSSDEKTGSALDCYADGKTSSGCNCDIDKKTEAALDPDICEKAAREVDLKIGAAGLHLVWPASIAVAVADLLGMTEKEILKGLESFSGQRMRCEKYGDVLLFDDTYNASPDSMKSSLRLIAALPARKRAAVLGDMLEQGSFAEELHREVGAAAAEANIDTLITIGELSEDMADEAVKRGLKDVRSFRDRESAVKAVEEITRPGTAILFKASHGMALDRLAKISREKAEQFAAK